MIALLAFGALAGVATAGTLVTVARDGYRRIPTRYAR
jgi:hypothetical protein